jgi:hypothetical protein
MWRLLEDCWSYDPEERPSLDEVLQQLERMMTLDQIQATRGGNASADASGQVEGDAVLSSSRFRKSFNKSDQPADGNISKVISMIQSLKL